MGVSRNAYSSALLPQSLARPSQRRIPIAETPVAQPSDTMNGHPNQGVESQPQPTLCSNGCGFFA